MLSAGASLYRECLRLSRQLRDVRPSHEPAAPWRVRHPADARDVSRQCSPLLQPRVRAFYRHQLRQSVVQHADESDPERIAVMVAEGRRRALWIVNRVRHTSLPPTAASRPELVVPSPSLTHSLTRTLTRTLTHTRSMQYGTLVPGRAA
jgi:hypothetical protein